MTGPVLLAALTATGVLLLAWQRRRVLRWAVALRRRQAGRVVYHDGDGLPSPTGARQTILTRTTVIKLQASRVAVIESEKTHRAAAIAADSEWFDVAAITGGDPAQGRIEFQRIDNAVPLWSWLVGRGATDSRVMAERVGQALAEIHQRLRIPLDVGESLGGPWRPEPGDVSGFSMNQDHEVALHGDFNAWNLLVTDEGAGLVIVDWAGSDLCSPWLVRGPWVFDAAWLIVTLFRSRLGPVERIGQAEAFAESFLAAYARGRRLPEAPLVCRDYLRHLMPVWRRPEIRGRRDQWLRPKLDVERLATFAGVRGVVRDVA